MALTASQVKNAQPRAKDYKLSDEKGLYALVTTNGFKYWRMKYRYGGKEKVLAFGVGDADKILDYLEVVHVFIRRASSSSKTVY